MSLAESAKLDLGNTPARRPTDMAQLPAVILQWEAASNKTKLLKIEVDITTEHAWGHS